MAYKPGDITKGVASRVVRGGLDVVGSATDWWELPLPAQLAQLAHFREDLRRFNLYDTEEVQSDGDIVVLDEPPPYRTYDGSQTDPDHPRMGQTGTRFGRNMPIEATYPQAQSMLDPSPREVSTHLLNRDSFKPATSLNVLAAAWLQFQNHDWFSHGDNSETEFIEVPLSAGDDWDGGTMEVRRTSPDSTNAGGTLPPTYVNKVTPWWDGSQLYGSTEERNRELRSGEEGKLKMDGDRLPEETKSELHGVALTGFSDNWWVGLEVMHTLFAREHNAICDMLRGHHPAWGDEQLFLTARLINAALIAKIHTIEWTPGILDTPALHIGMNANWYGVLPKWVKQTFGHIGSGELVSGIVGSPLDHHTAPYSITSEFVAVYRMHPLLPDDYVIRSHDTGEVTAETDLTPIQGHGTREAITEHTMTDWIYSLGVAHPGAITLHNHPNALRDLVRVNGDHVDIGTIDILRDRERGVPRYNDFREKLRKKRIKSFDDLTPNPEWNAQIRDVYSGDIDKVDTHVGMLGEKLPPGFGFSDTAFRIFILMASRRLKSDRFFTNDYTPAVYTPEGIEWVEGNLFGDVVLRHHPGLAPALEGSKNAFAPWRAAGT
ncbi:MAG TPA: peroxidase family protein [Solirubrobacteraceae bacterium]|nr:peroxidase family protein [Solirubrobacteraceae bacterium]